MMGGLFALFGLVVPLGIIVGIGFLIAKAMSGKDKDADDEGAGVHIRRLFVYLLMLAMLLLAGLGVVGLIDAVWPSSGVIVDNSAAAARSIAFVLVGLPVYAGLWWYTLRQFADDPREERSLGWAFYLVVALVGSLVATMALVGAILSSLVDGDTPDRTVTINAVVWAGVWLAHWVVSRRHPTLRGEQTHLLLGSVAGLGWTFAGLIATVGAVLSTIYDRLFLTSIAGGGVDDLLRPAMVLVVGIPVWWWYWIRHQRNGQRSVLWLMYTLLLGVMGGLVTAISGAGVALFTVIIWFIGDIGTSAANHFDALAVPVASVAIGVGGWLYHAHVVGQRDETTRVEVDRVYSYLVAAAGLLVAASGIATLIASVLIAASTRGSVATDTGDAVAVALTLLLIGAPLWWRYWSTIQRFRRIDLADELGSVTRRIYIVALFGVAAIVAVISLIVIVFIVVEDALEGVVGADTIEASAVAVALLVTAGATFWYHLAVFREDRSDMEALVAESPPAAPDVARPLTQRGELEQTLDELTRTGTHRFVVAVDADGYEVEPLDD